jgi:hypothetical protein
MRTRKTVIAYIAVASIAVGVLIGCGGKDKDKERASKFAAQTESWVDTASYKLMINLVPAGGGIVTHNPDLEIYPAGTLVNLTAEAGNGYKFRRWVIPQMSDDGAIEISEYAQPNINVYMDRNATVSAVFEAD